MSSKSSKAPNKVGRPCNFCKDKEEYLRKTKEYVEQGKADRPRPMFILELAVILGFTKDAMWDYRNKKTEQGVLEHEEFSDLVKEVELLQEVMLQKRLLGRNNPTGSIFLLKTKHGYIETDKKILAGDSMEPLEITIIEQRKEDE